MDSHGVVNRIEASCGGGERSIGTPQMAQPKKHSIADDSNVVSMYVFIVLYGADKPKATPRKQIFQEVDKSVNLHTALRALHANSCEYHEQVLGGSRPCMAGMSPIFYSFQLHVYIIYTL